MNKKLVALALLGVMAVNLLTINVNTYGAQAKSSQNPEIIVEYSTGTQTNAKEKLDENRASAEENDGSYEEVILVKDQITIDTEWEDIHIASADDLIEFSKMCELDTWSLNKHVYLDEDIILSGSEFETIPTFGGIFEGQGHVIEGLIYSDSVSNYGLFSYVQTTGVIKDLTVKGNIRPKGSQIITGGIVGDNSGQLLNCSFEGNISGYDYVGGITGYNELSGIISGCLVKGDVNGAHYTGGIAGENVGLISNCINHGNINSELVDRAISLVDVDLSAVASNIFSIAAGEDADDKSKSSIMLTSGSIDTGGVAGLSIGVIQFCTNYGTVGYEHVGYNIGGICGRQSGYVYTCTNEGKVLGRKDIGGIVGQAEPYVKVNFTEDIINKLTESIDDLHDIVDTTIKDANNESDTVSARLKAIKGFTDKALDDTSYLSDQTVLWTDGVIEQVNEASGRAEFIIQESAKNGGPLDDTADSFRHLYRAVDDFEKAADDIDIYKYMTDDQKAQYNDARDRFEYLSNERKKNDDLYKNAGINYYIFKMRNDVSENGVPFYPNSRDIRAINDAYIDITDAVLASTSLDDWKKVVSIRHMDGVAFEEKEGDKKLKDDATEALKSAVSLSEPTLVEVNKHAERDTVNAYNKEYGATISNSEAELARLADIMATILLDIAPDMDETTRKDAKASAEELKKASSDMEIAVRETKGIMSSLAEKGSIVFPELGDEYRMHTNSLVSALQGMSDNMGILNDEVAAGNSTVFGDMGGINDQFNVIMQLYTDAIDGVLNNDYEATIEDESVLVAETSTDATIADCVNKARIEGDLDVSGIAGAMGIEYDYDVESDVTGINDTNLNSTYKSKCILRNNKNNGFIKSQKSFIGGVCGLQEIGTILGCENYGKIKSIGGKYVGGIVGESYSYIQKSYEKSILMGHSYVGGIVGHGTNILNCYSIVDITDSDSFYGAIAGSVEEGAKVRYNYFVSEENAGIDRVSYSMKAEPVSYETLISANGIPDEFKSIKVVFLLNEDDEDNETEIKTINVEYGGHIAKDEYPNINDKDDSYAKWDIDELDRLFSDKEVTAKYVRYRTTIAGEQKRMNSQSAVLVDGMFKEEDQVICQQENATIPGLEKVNECWNVKFPDDGLTTHQVRYMKPDDSEGSVKIYVLKNGTWEETENKLFGEYNIFEADGNNINFAVICEDDSFKIDKKCVILSVIVLVAVLISVVVIVKHKKTKK